MRIINLPYRSNSELPDSVKGVLPEKAQDVFRNVVNSQLDRGLSEERSFASAWSALSSQGWKKGDDGKYHKEESAKKSFEVRGKIEKADGHQKLVFGWASIVEKDNEVIVDHHQDIITPDDIEKAAYNYVLESRDAGEMHKSVGVGRIVESIVFTKEKQEALGLTDGALPIGWWIGFKVDDNDVFAKVLDGTYSMFSIGGTAIRSSLNDE